MIRQIFFYCCLRVWESSLCLFSFVEIMKDVREGALSS